MATTPAWRRTRAGRRTVSSRSQVKNFISHQNLKQFCDRTRCWCNQHCLFCSTSSRKFAEKTRSFHHFCPPPPLLSLYFHFHTTSKSQMRTSYFSVLPFLFRCKYTFSQPCKTVVVSRQKTTASNVKLQRRSPRRRRRWSRRRPPQLRRRRRRSSSSGGGGRSTEVSADSSPPLTHLAQLSLPHA